MRSYSLAKLAARPKGSKTILPPVNVRLSAEKQYLTALRAMLTQVVTQTRETIVPLYEQEQAQKRASRAMTADADRTWFAGLDALVAQLVRLASNTVNSILDLESKRHTDTFMATAKRALGIDLTAVVMQEDLADYLQAAAARNASLIKSLGDDVLKRVEQTVYANSIAGNSVTTLRKGLQEQFGIVDRRAKLIARDQTSKLNADLNRIRQEQAGVTSYSWMTAHDERVRPLHRSLDGKTYKWGEATGAEQGLPPGQPVNCRCVARGIVEF
ncbi:phage head morphogenesis protein [Rhizobium bangladeshense]|uniref:phage head morphogenesis protein n=1 Tax=Rhizobium bangladeshense TaxID=1138189 RepID=UPI001C83DD2E|nr:phage minor head protein [Rhizobium bangladeshense]MBX4889784.1 minor capsid protein [Rhizobium bangladeshense]